MTQMIRKQIYIQRRQQAMLKRIARQRGVSEAEVIRNALDRELSAGTVRSAILDTSAFQKAHRFMLSRRQLAASEGTPYHWRREDAYEDRLNRFDRKTG